MTGAVHSYTAKDLCDALRYARETMSAMAAGQAVRDLDEQLSYINLLLSHSYGPSWRSPLDKPAHLPGEHHSEDVLLWMKPRRTLTDDHGIRIGHVSCGHWRPSGGNGNFDDDVQGWMPLPSTDATGTPQEKTNG